MRKAAAQLEGHGDLLEKPKSVDSGAEQITAQAEPDIEVVVEGAGPPVKQAEPAKKVDDPEVADLKKQLEELKKSERLAKEASERVQRDRDADRLRHESESVQHKTDTAQAQLDAIDAAIATAKAEADGAERDFEVAVASGDYKAQAESNRRAARAEANIGRLEDGKIELEQRIEATKTQAEKVARAAPREEQRDAVEALQVPERAKEWLREHREFVENPRKNLKLQSAHFDAIDEGYKEFSTDYFVAVERLLGLRKEEKQVIEKEDDDENDNKGAIVSAPVSRDSGGTTQSGGGRRVTLTKDQAEAARIAGISEKVYAENLLKLEQAKKSGHYQER